MLANRFVHAIKEKYPHDNLAVYSDTENNPVQIDLLRNLWPSLYTRTAVMPERKSQAHRIKTQFGEEVYNADIDNTQDAFLERFRKADKFYDLCIDRMEWAYYDFDWLKYFRFFPKPEHVPQYPKWDLPEKFILANFYSRPNSPYLLEQWYVERLIEEASKLLPLVIVCTLKNAPYYDFCKDNPRVKVMVASLTQVAFLASKCECFIGIDSGIRCLPYYFDKPTFFFTTYCQEYGKVPLSHLMRWALYELNVFPMHYDIKKVLFMLENVIKNPACKLYPFIGHKDIDNTIIRRIKTA